MKNQKNELATLSRSSRILSRLLAAAPGPLEIVSDGRPTFPRQRSRPLIKQSPKVGRWQVRHLVAQPPAH